MPNTEKIVSYDLPLRQQMLLVFTGVMLVFSAGIAFVIDSNLRSSAIESAAKQNGQNAMFFASMLENDLEQELSAIRSRADNLDDMGLPQKPEKLQKLLDNLKKSQPAFSWIGYVETSGKVLAATDGMLKGFDVSQRPWFQIGLKKAGTVDVHDAVLLSKLLKADENQPLRFIDVVSPVKSRDGTVIGVLGGHLSVDWLSQQIDFYAKSLYKESDFQPTVIGSDGLVRFGQAQEPALINELKNQQAKTNAEVNWFIFHSPTKGDELIVYARHAGDRSNERQQWTTLICLPRELIDARVRAERLLAVSGIILASLVAWFTLWWLLRIASNPVRTLMLQINKSRETHKPLELLPGLPKEFSEITNSINEFLISIQTRELMLEQAMNDMRDSFTGVTESFPGVLFRVEEVGVDQFVFSYLSPSAQHYLNLDVAVLPVSTERFYEQVEPSERDQFKRSLRQQAFNSQNLDITLPLKGKDGQVRQLRVIGRLRTVDGRKRMWDGVMVNVTDLINAKKIAADADAAKSKFLATMSHEIRTPLNGILGFAQILLQEVETAQQKSDVRKIIDTSETLTRILNDILDFSKIEEGKLELESRPFNLSDLIESSASLFHVEAQKRNLDFTVDVTMGHPYRLMGDPTRLRQILSNLLSNALKFTSAGNVKLIVKTDSPINSHSLLHITVKDSGIGINLAQQKRLFERFQQSDSSIFRRFGGSGLGLAICKGLVDGMGGSIQVKSIPGQGTSFEILLNLAIVQYQEVLPELAKPSLMPSLNILVVDDVPTNRELIVRFLSKEGHTVTEAENGLVATELAQDNIYDIILMDVDMPICNGIEATQKIRNGNGLSRNAHIIALTGYAFEKDIANVLDCGMNAHLAKPINFQKLREKIRLGFNA